MADDVLVGLAVTSHNNGQLEHAQYTNVNWPAAPYEKPWDLQPLDGSTKIPLLPTLSWQPGDSATSHDVYIGTDPGALSLVDTVTDTSYTSAVPLAEGTMYYWQIVEQPLNIAGPVYSFKTERVGNYGTVQRCVWDNIGGTNVYNLKRDLRYPGSPSWCDEPTRMATYDFMDNYGQRMQGYLVPETSGDYTFWIAGDDGIELWLSTDDKACNLEKIAEHVGWTNAHQWFDAPEQQSAAIPLVANQKYLIRAFLKEGGGGDNCQVAWHGPDQPNWPVAGSDSAVITGYYTIPTGDPYASMPNPIDGTTITPLEAAEPATWLPGAGAVAHNVYAGPDPGSMVLVGTVAMPDTSIMLPPAAVGDTVYWMVEADDGTQTYPTTCPWSYSVEEWASVDIGRMDVDHPDYPYYPYGSSSYDEDTGVYTISAGGDEIWGNVDQFHYLYTTMEMTRDEGMVQARILGVTHLADWTRCGVQIRESRAPGARSVVMSYTPAQRAVFQARENTNQGWWDSYIGNEGLPTPQWVRITRNGNRFDGYYSEDGENWTHRNTAYVNMEPGKYVCVGLHQCHHNGADQAQLSVGTADNLSVHTPDPYASWNPSPGHGEENIPLDVTVSWNPGEGVEQHILYFSDSYEDVMYGLVEPIILPGDTTEYHVGILNLNTVYYWAVDSVRREGRDMLTTLGDIWSFRVEPYRLIDDFEAYCVTPEPLPPQEEVLGEILVEAVPPPDQAWVEPQVLLEATPPDAGCLIAEWAFEGNYDDTSGSGFHGTPVGDVNIVTDAERGQVLSLAGGQDYVDCGNPAELNFSTGDWSLSAWVKNTMTGTGDTNKGSIIANGGDGGGGHRYGLVQSEQQEAEVTLVIDDNSGDGCGSSYNKKQTRGDITKVNDGVWHHVLGVREGDRIRIYIDGVKEGDNGIGGTDYDLSCTVQANVLIGAMTKASDSSIYKTYEGLIDDVQIYDCALTEGNARYMAGIGDIIKDGYFGPCIVHWAMDEGSGSVANDSSGNDLHGAITDAAWTAVTADGSAACLDINGFGGNVVNEAAGPYLNNLAGLSISMWIQSDLIDTDRGFIIGRNPEGNDQRGIRYDTVGASGGGDDVIKYGVACTDGADETESSVGIQTTEWQHIVMVWDNDGSGTNLYVNGALDLKSFDGTNRTGLTSGYTKLLAGKGSKDGSATQSWDGRIDDVRVYDYRLSEGEVRYLAGLGNLYGPPSYQPLIGHWEAEGTADDSSGNENHGIPLGDATIVMDPVMGLVGKFDGNGDAINVGANPLFNPTDDMTITAWVNMTSWGGSWGNCILGKRGEGGVGWQLRRFGGDPRFSFTTRGIGNDDYPRSNLVPNMNQWYHLAAIRDGTQKRLYIDGKLDSSAGVSGGQISSCPHDVYIGARANGGNTGPEAFFNGMLDDVRFYNTALTLPQISGIIGCDNTLEATWSSKNNATLDYMTSHWGSQSMELSGVNYAKATRPAPFEDWSSGKAKALVLYFKGDPGNAIHGLELNMSVHYPDGGFDYITIPYEGDMSNVNSEEWTEWNADFSTVLSSLAMVKAVAVTFKGDGTINVDDLRVYPSRCVPELSSASDLNQDCIVDGKDLRILVGDYLMGDSTIVAVAPDDTKLLASYQFEGNYDDSSGNDNHGTPVGEGIAIETDPVRGDVLSLPGGDNIFVDCGDVGNSGTMPVTIACWAKADHTSIPNWTLVFGFTGTDTGAGGCGSHFNIGSIGGPGGVGAHCWCWEETIFTDTEALDWRHYAMTYDGSKIEYYGDGVLKDTDVAKSNYQDLSIRADRVHIGSRVTQASSFPGKVDDARVYNYTLSWAEIRNLAGQGDLYLPLESIANLHDEEPINSKKINFKDYSVLTGDWLDQIVWP
jgi:hypothetical protein